MLAHGIDALDVPAFGDLAVFVGCVVDEEEIGLAAKPSLFANARTSSRSSSRVLTCRTEVNPL
jgi:hypothetical protein